MKYVEREILDTSQLVSHCGLARSDFKIAEIVAARNAAGMLHELIQESINERLKQEISMMPLGIVANLSPEQLADLIAYLESLH